MPRGNPELAVLMGKRMAVRREELKLTQEKVADRAGLTHQQYNKLENGKCCMGSDTLRRVSLALEISSDYILTGESQAKYENAVHLLKKMDDRQLRFAEQALAWMLESTKDR